MLLQNAKLRKLFSLQTYEFSILIDESTDIIRRSFDKSGKFLRDGATMNCVVYGQEVTLFKLPYTKFQPKITLSLHVADIWHVGSEHGSSRKN